MKFQMLKVCEWVMAKEILKKEKWNSFLWTKPLWEKNNNNNEAKATVSNFNCSWRKLFLLGNLECIYGVYTKCNQTSEAISPLAAPRYSLVLSDLSWERIFQEDPEVKCVHNL